GAPIARRGHHHERPPRTPGRRSTLPRIMTLDRINTPVTRLAVAQGVAYAGRGAAMTALIWRLYELSGSSWWVSGAMLAVFGVSTILSPWSGHLGDRHDRRQVVMVSALIAAAGFALCVPLSLLGWLTPIVMV